jgi:hypothetical protein
MQFIEVKLSLYKRPLCRDRHSAAIQAMGPIHLRK